MRRFVTEFVILSLFIGSAGWARSIRVSEASSLVINPLDILTSLNLGWTLFKDNRPISTSSLATAEALPAETLDSSSLDYWLPMIRKGFHYGFKNRLDVEQLSLDYEIQFFAGGSYRDKGKYLAGLKVVPTHAKVGWGYRMDLKAIAGHPINLGSIDQPLPMIPLQIIIQGSHPMKSWQRTEQFLVYGDGRFVQLAAATTRDK